MTPMKKIKSKIFKHRYIEQVKFDQKPRFSHYDIDTEREIPSER